MCCQFFCHFVSMDVGRYGMAGGGVVFSSRTTPASRPHLMSLKKNYSQLIIMLILFSAYRPNQLYPQSIKGGRQETVIWGLMPGNLLLQFIWCLSFNHFEVDLFVVIWRSAKNGYLIDSERERERETERGRKIQWKVKETWSRRFPAGIRKQLL